MTSARSSASAAAAGCRKKILGHHKVVAGNLPPNLPMLELDAVLFEQVLVQPAR